MEVYDTSYIPTEIPRSSEVLDSLWVPPSSSPAFQGSSSMVNFEVETSDNPDHLFNSDLDESGAEKKRRLKASQVKFLEKSFEADNKLEPDRKIQLAKELGLQPRQVAIWFQNRRARFKTKFLEKEYDSLKTSYDNLKKDYDSLFADNHKLRNEIQLLMQKLESEVKPEPWDPTAGPQPKKQFLCKQEDAASSSKSDVLDSDSPRYYNQSGILEPTADSSLVENYSDFNDDERLLQPSLAGSLPKLELEYLMPNSCGLGYPIQDQGTWFMQY